MVKISDNFDIFPEVKVYNTPKKFQDAEKVDQIWPLKKVTTLALLLKSMRVISSLFQVCSQNFMVKFTTFMFKNVSIGAT